MRERIFTPVFARWTVQSRSRSFCRAFSVGSSCRVLIKLPVLWCQILANKRRRAAFLPNFEQIKEGEGWTHSAHEYIGYLISLIRLVYVFTERHCKNQQAYTLGVKIAFIYDLLKCSTYKKCTCTNEISVVLELQYSSRALIAIVSACTIKEPTDPSMVGGMGHYWYYMTIIYSI
jgi:hypothetical protein